MKLILILAGVFFLHYLLRWFREGHGGIIGRKVRWSDRMAWIDAVNKKEHELSELKKMEPRP